MDLSAYAAGYQLLLTRLVASPTCFVPVFLLVCLCCISARAMAGSGFLSRAQMEAASSCMCEGRRDCVLRRPRGCATWSSNPSVRQFLPGELDNILDNIGLPYSGMNTMHLTSGIIGAARCRCHGDSQSRITNLLRIMCVTCARSCPREFPERRFISCPPISRRRS